MALGSGEESEREGGRRGLPGGRLRGNEPGSLDELKRLQRLVLLFAQGRVERERVAPGAPQLVESIRRRLRIVAEQGPQPGFEQIAPRRRLEARRHDVATSVVPDDRKPGAQCGDTIELAELAQQVDGAQDRPLAVGELAE